MKTTLLAACSLVALVSGCGQPASSPQGSNSSSEGNYTVSTSAQTNPLVGQTASSFSLPNLKGSNTSLQQILTKHEPVVLNAWASWCYPCQQETPDLVALSKKYAGKVEFVGVNMTYDDSVSGARSFVQKYHIPYTVALDKTGAFAKSYQIVGYPTTFIVSPSGKIDAVHIGILTKSQMQNMIQQAISAEPKSP